MTKWTRARVLKAVLNGESLAGKNLSRLNLRGADLRGADLRGAMLRDADLRDTNLRCANLRDADLRDTNLRCANLRDANLQGANLQGANLSCASLSYANLRGAGLSCADLRHTYLWCADLRDVDLTQADLRTAIGAIAAVLGPPSGDAFIVPTVDGWRVRVGCWVGTTKQLRRMIQSDCWVESNSEEREARRPAMLALCDLFDAHKKLHKGMLNELRTKWISSENKETKQ